MKLIEADKVEQAIKDYWKAQVNKALTLTDGNEKRINIYLEHNHELLKAIDELPSVQPDTTTHDSIPAETGKNDDDRTSGDCISRQAAIDAARDWYEGLIYGSFKGLEKRLRALPSAQPEKETAKRVLWTGWKGFRDTRYKCPNCKKPVKNDDVYCHRCGQKLMFPHISFTDYIPGEKQELIVRWDDE